MASPAAQMALLDEITGHVAQREQLKTLAASNSTPHALMFVGPSGVGKRSCAIAFAAGLLTAAGKGSLSPQEITALVRSGRHPDVQALRRDPEKKDLNVEAIRSLCSALQLKPYYGACSVAIIDNAEEMNVPASNALLMTLEEPPRNTYLLLVTDSPQTLPETIVSRCQLIHFGELTEPETLAVIERCLGPLVQNTALLRQLGAYAGTSLAALGLGGFVAPNALALADEAAVRAHLDEFVSRTRTLEDQLNPFLAPAKNKQRSLAHAVSLATALSADKELLPLAWQALRVKLRTKLRTAKSAAEAEQWADALLTAVEAEQLTRQRNLSPQLQLSNVLLRVAEISA